MSIRVVLFCSLFLLFSNTYSQQFDSTEKSMVVIDAGSSGSRFHLYTFQLDASGFPRNIQEIEGRAVKPGLSSIALDDKSIADYLSQLIPDSALGNNIPVYFYATGGMRLLPEDNQKQFYAKIQSWFAQKPQWALQEAKTISGEDEAVYGWLSVNYQLNTLQSGEAEDIGVMDMGGASVELTLPIHSATNRNHDTFVLYNHTYTLYAYSVLGVGQNLVSQYYQMEPSCQPYNYPISEQILGNGDAQTCSDKIADFLNVKHQISSEVKEIQAEINQKTWYTMGGLYYLLNQPIFQFEGAQASASSWLNAADKKICHAQWSELKDANLAALCLNAAYYHSLIMNGYQMDENTLIHTLSGKPGDWSMGVILYAYRHA